MLVPHTAFFVKPRYTLLERICASFDSSLKVFS